MLLQSTVYFQVTMKIKTAKGKKQKLKRLKAEPRNHKYKISGENYVFNVNLLSGFQAPTHTHDTNNI